MNKRSRVIACLPACGGGLGRTTTRAWYGCASTSTGRTRGRDQSPPHQVRRTLEVLRTEPWRGLAVVLDVDDQAVGYALLVSFWSNELGGEVCDVDELFVTPEHRSRGNGRSLFEAIERGELWPTPPVAMALGTTPGNHRARRLYERLGFESVGVSMVRRAR
jgi:GNAT superfamily N-acetyltransferase